MRRLEELTTEAINPAHAQLDELPTLELVKAINAEDHTVADAVAAALPQIAEAVEKIAHAFRQGGRLIYIGAGTSGRLGALDASECPPTFGVAPEMVQPVIAGGPAALLRSIEGAEDSAENGAAEMETHAVTDRDVVCGLSASGRTPFVLGALTKARELGAATVGIACNRPSEMESLVDVMIAVITGPEIISGSTRLKAGTAQKMVLNMLSTASMVRLGKVYGNLMVDVRPLSQKLVERAQRIIRVVTGVDAATAQQLFTESGGRPKLAIVMQKRGCNAAAAEQLLARNDGLVRAALADTAPLDPSLGC